MIILDLFVNVCDSMGANIVNTIVEYVAPYVEGLTGGRAGLKILSNLCMERRAVAQFEIPISKMGWKDVAGEIVTKRMIEGYRFAQLDPFRATTHNKGIFNGIDAVAIATGQDWRSIEASCHAYASVNNKKAGYQPLNHYELVRSKREQTKGELVLRGSIEIPISVGSQGGVINSNALYQNNMKLLGFPNAQQLSEIIAAVGLCQNFGALRALAVEGIQKGHMNLHARNIAISGGVPTHLVEEATRFMRSRSKMNVDTAKAYLQAYDLFEQVRQEEEDEAKSETTPFIKKKETVSQRQKPLSTFYVELECESLDESIVIHVALDCLVGSDKQQIHLAIEPVQTKATTQEDIQSLLFGPKGYEWLRNIFSALEIVSLNGSEKTYQPEVSGSGNSLPIRKLVYKLKLIAIIIDLLTSNMIALDSERSLPVIQQLTKSLQQDRLLRKIDIAKLLERRENASPLVEDALKVGLTLLSECMRVFEYNIDSTRIANDLLKTALLEELYLILDSQVQTHLQWKEVVESFSKQGEAKPLSSPHTFDQDVFLLSRQKRLCATMMLLCDCVNMNPSLVTPSTLKVIRRLGCIYEVEITLAHDLLRWKPTLNDANLYTYWLIKHSLFPYGDIKANRTLFIQTVFTILQQKKQELNPLLDDKLKILSDITSEVIRSFYDFNETIAPKPNL